MTLKKFYGSTIQEARDNAREVLGASYIVVETKESGNSGKAWIHVLNEKSSNGDKTSANGSGNSDLFPKAFGKIKETVSEGLQIFNKSTQLIKDSGSIPKSSASDSNSTPAGDSREQTYNRGQSLSRPQHVPEFSFNKERATPLAEKVEKLSDRFDRLEQLIGKQLPGLNIKTISHPAFQQLMSSGVPHPVINKWFNELIAEGEDPYSGKAGFTRKLALKVKDSLDIAADTPEATYMIFTGENGSGKSSLIMKLLQHTELLAGARCAMITICGTNETNYFSPLAAFAYEHDLSHYMVREQQQLQELKEKRGAFDHILIEMPTKSAVLSMEQIDNFIPQGESREVHTVINAALNQTYLSASPLPSHPFAEQYIDFTHMDCLPEKGHLLPVMQRIHHPVRYISGGPGIPHDLSAFKPADFAKQLLTS